MPDGGEAREYRVFGPPGTGKTTWLARQAQHATDRYGHDAVVIASFTRTAAAEIAGRDTGVERENVGTLHALCYRALGRPPIAETHAQEWNAEAPEYRLPVRAKKDVDDPYDDEDGDEDTVPGNELLSEYSRRRALQEPADWWPLTVRAFAARWEAWKSRQGYIDFTDMIALALRDVAAAPGAPAVGLFDEVQDFSALELALVRRWAERMDFVILAGDDDQALYRFKGATPQAFLQPPVTDAFKRVLAQSYRVPAAVHALAQDWVSVIAEREPKAYAPRDAAGEVTTSRATWKHPEPLLPDLDDTLAAGQTAMILAPCGYMLRPVIAVLKEAGIPFHNPYRPKRKDWNPFGPATGVSTRERLLAYLHPDDATWGAQAHDWTREDLARWGRMLRADGVLRRGAKQAISALQGTERVSAAELDGWFERAALEGALDLDPLWLSRHVTKAYAERLAYPLAVCAASGRATLHEAPRVTVGTVHSVKGGEADNVVVFPDLSHAGYLEWHDHADGGHDSVRRVFYVALTRARERLVLCRRASPRSVRLEG
jgi:DNA helicase II / ATP-dependent DNA helicase PcrA